MARNEQLPPVNASPPPWGRTFVLEGNKLLHPTRHAAIQHPNTLHMTRDPAVPFAGSVHSGNAFAGRARHDPPFSSAGTLAGGGRK